LLHDGGPQSTLFRRVDWADQSGHRRDAVEQKSRRAVAQIPALTAAQHSWCLVPKRNRLLFSLVLSLLLHWSLLFGPLVVLPILALSESGDKATVAFLQANLLPPSSQQGPATTTAPKLRPKPGRPDSSKSQSVAAMVQTAQFGNPVADSSVPRSEDEVKTVLP